MELGIRVFGKTEWVFRDMKLNEAVMFSSGFSNANSCFHRRQLLQPAQHGRHKEDDRAGDPWHLCAVADDWEKCGGGA